jgi:regulator of sigma E protease
VIAAIPLGGYVKMLDEREFDGTVGPAGLTGSFNRQPVSKRMAITVAGPVANFLFAIAAFWVMFVIGRPDYQPLIGTTKGMAAAAGLQTGERVVRADGEPVTNWSDLSIALAKGTMDRKALVLDTVDPAGGAHQRTLPLDTLPRDNSDEANAKAIGIHPYHWMGPIEAKLVDAGSAAEAGGMRAGDVLVSIDGDLVRDGDDVADLIQKHAAPGHALAMKVQRAGALLDLSITPRQSKDDKGSDTWRIGVRPANAAPPAKPDATLRYGPLAAIPEALKSTWGGVCDTFDLVAKMVSGAASPKNLSGVVGIAQAANASASMGLGWFLSFLALVSISLGVLNLLPIPVLDGGQLIYYLVELIKGRPVSERVQIAAQFVGLFLIVALMSLALYNDVFHLASRG